MIALIVAWLRHNLIVPSGDGGVERELGLLDIWVCDERTGQRELVGDVLSWGFVSCRLGDLDGSWEADWFDGACNWA